MTKKFIPSLTSKIYRYYLKEKFIPSRSFLSFNHLETSLTSYYFKKKKRKIFTEVFIHFILHKHIFRSSTLSSKSKDHVDIFGLKKKKKIYKFLFLSLSFHPTKRQKSLLLYSTLHLSLFALFDKRIFDYFKKNKFTNLTHPILQIFPEFQ